MQKIVFVLIAVLLVSIPAQAQNGKLMRQKRKWIAENKLPYFTDMDFPTLVRDKVLVKITSNKFHVLDSRLDYDAEYIRPFVLDALHPFEVEFLKRFGKPIRINAAFRTVQHHADLRDRNRNAATGFSPHSTGCTLDISLLAMDPVEQRFTQQWFSARNFKTVVFTIEHRPMKMYDIFFRPPQPPPEPHHRHKKG